MTGFDAIILTVVVLSVIYSTFKGMIREIFSLLALVIGYLVAVHFQANMAEIMGNWISNHTVSTILSFFILFVISLMFVASLGSLIRKYLLKSNTISGWDRVLGSVFGFVKGVVIVIIFLFPLKFFEDTYENLTEDSMVAEQLEELTDQLGDQIDLNDEVIDKIPESLEEIQRDLDPRESIEDIKEDIQEKARTIKDSTSEGVQKTMEPLEEYSEKDKQELEDILRDLSKD